MPLMVQYWDLAVTLQLQIKAILIKVEAVDKKQSMDDKENMPPMQRRFSNNKSVQMTTFIGRRVKTKELLKSLEEKC